MRVYAGSVAGERALNELRKYSMGRLVAANSWKNPIADIPWVFDNGAFHAFNNGKPFDKDAFARCAIFDEETGFNKIQMGSYAIRLPDFGVCPDIVRGGKKSLDFSLSWMERLSAFPEFPWYLAVQDGMSVEDVAEAWDLAIELECPFGGIFVGGSLEWKFETTPQWVQFAHERGVKVHVGRISSIERLKWAERLGVDSVDSAAFGPAYAYKRVKQAADLVTLQQWMTPEAIARDPYHPGHYGQLTLAEA